MAGQVAQPATHHQQHRKGQRIAGHDPGAVRGTRLAVIKGREIPMHEAEMLAEAFRERNLHTEDSLEGPKAFVEKREPNWRCR